MRACPRCAGLMRCLREAELVPEVKKRCCACKLDLPLEAFGKDVDRKDRLSSRCKSCNSARKGKGMTRLEDVIKTGGEQLLAFGSPLERVCAEKLIETGSMADAATLAGVEVNVLRAHLTELRRKAAARGYSPAHDMVKTVPEGFSVKGVSSYYRTLPDGSQELAGQWVKSKSDESSKIAALLDAMSHIADSWQSVADPVPAPLANNERLLACYPLGDPHVGLYSWKEETGTNFDLKIAERNLVAAVDALVVVAPAAKHALIVNVGDYYHADGKTNQTTAGTPVDVDGRWAKVLGIGVRIMRRCIDRALEKHALVTVINAKGNHDEHTSTMLSVCLAQYYEREPRVTIDTTPGKFQWMRFGKNLIGVTHGDTVKLTELGEVMACDRPLDWAETLHRYWITGHIHHDTVKELRGCIVESFRTLAPADAWHRAKGYRSGRDMKVLIFDQDRGQILRHTVGIADLEATE